MTHGSVALTVISNRGECLPGSRIRRDRESADEIHHDRGIDFDFQTCDPRFESLGVADDVAQIQGGDSSNAGSIIAKPGHGLVEPVVHFGSAGTISGPDSFTVSTGGGSFGWFNWSFAAGDPSDSGCDERQNCLSLETGLGPVE